MGNSVRRASAGILYAILAIGLAACVLAASSGYSEATVMADDGQDIRVRSQFLRTKLRQADEAGAVSVSDDGSELRIREEYPEGVFWTVLYCHDGWLMEQLMADGLDMEPAMGDRIVRCAAFSCSIDGDIAYASFRSDDGTSQDVAVRLRSGGSA